METPNLKFLIEMHQSFDMGDLKDIIKLITNEKKATINRMNDITETLKTTEHDNGK